MSTINTILAEAKTLEKSYRAVLSLVAKVEEIGDLDKAYEAAEVKLREHKQEVATAATKADLAMDRLDVVNDEVDRAKEKASEVMAEAHAEAKTVLADASHEVAEKFANAKKLVADAEAQVVKHNEYMRDTAIKHKRRMETCDGDYAEAARTLENINKVVAEARQKLGA